MVHDSAELVAAVTRLLDDPEAAREIGENGRRILEKNRGALSRLIAVIDPLMAA